MARHWKWITLTLLGVLVLAGSAWLYILNEMKKPLFSSGELRDGSGVSEPLYPPPQPDDPTLWQVSDSITLYHFAEGSGAPVLVLHGGPGLPFAEPLPALTALADRHLFHYYDQRGSGRSTRPFDRFEKGSFTDRMHLLESTLGLGAQIADIERIRRILKVDRIDLIGHSFGGFIAALYAAEFPGHVGRLVLASPADVLVLPNENDLFQTIATHLPESRRADFEAFVARYFDFRTVFDKSEQELIALNAEIPAFYAEATASAGAPLPELPAAGRPGGWMTMAVFFSMGGKADLRPALAGVTAPTLVLHGADDLQTEAGSRRYADSIPGAEFVVLPDTTHFLFHQNADRTAELVRTFLAQ